MNLELNGKKALVFGSSQGIGKAISESLIAEGADVIINGRTEESLKKTADEIKAFDYIVGDLSKAGEARNITDKALEKFGNIDIVVMNTGGPKKGSFLEIDNEQWHEDFQSLWMSVIESFKVTIPIMKENHFGRLLLVTSIAAKEPLAGLTTSNGFRAGLSGLCRSLSSEIASQGITVNLLLPGYTNTDRLKALNLSEEKVKALVPAGRLGKPSELADLAAFLASPKASYITGQSIAVDGGVLRSH